MIGGCHNLNNFYACDRASDTCNIPLSKPQALLLDNWHSWLWVRGLPPTLCLFCMQMPAERGSSLLFILPHWLSSHCKLFCQVVQVCIHFIVLLCRRLPDSLQNIQPRLRSPINRKWESLNFTVNFWCMVILFHIRPKAQIELAFKQWSWNAEGEGLSETSRSTAKKKFWFGSLSTNSHLSPFESSSCSHTIILHFIHVHGTIPRRLEFGERVLSLLFNAIISFQGYLCESFFLFLFKEISTSPLQFYVVT